MQTAITASAPAGLTQAQKDEWLTCAESPLYFIHHYVAIYDALMKDWVPFKLWPAQASTLKIFQLERLVVVLKARQIGLTWLALGYALWLMIFWPTATILLYSRRDDEAIDLLDFRLKGMYRRLPRWMQARSVVADSKHEWELSNGSRAKAMPTTAGDSYTVTLVIGDEFDLIPDQDRIMASVKPTIINGGQMILLSRPDKGRPQSRFKAIYRAAKAGLNTWVAVFLPWYVHPQRDAAWYAVQRDDILSTTGGEDELYEQYPATDAEALAARMLDKRIPATWLGRCYREMEPLLVMGQDGADDVPDGMPAIPGLTIFKLPEEGRRYVMGADPAEGLPTSDDSSLTVMDLQSHEEVARLDGHFEPKIVFPRHIDQIGQFYQRASVLVERNNHGHAVIGWLQVNGAVYVLDGHDNRPGWNNSPAGKVMLYDDGASMFMHGDTILHDFGTQVQIGSIEKDTLSAPEGEHDDKAVSYVLALKAAQMPQGPQIDFV